jgi:integrase
MPSRARKPKADKGTVQVKASNGRLQLVFTHAGQRYYLSPGYSDTPKYRRAIERKAAIIDEDIEKDRFDSMLDKYRPKPKFVLKQEAIDAKPSLLKLWNSFMEFKRPQCSPSTMYKQYGTFTNYLAALPTHDLERASEILEYRMREIPPKSCKRFITRLNACCKLAVRAGHITHSPFAGMASDIKIPKGSRAARTISIPFRLKSETRF